MDTENAHDAELAARLRRLEVSAVAVPPAFDYDGMMERNAVRQARGRQRLRMARVTAGALAIALVGASLWRLDQRVVAPLPQAADAAPAAPLHSGETRIVRADTYLAVAALEDHIASVDDALNVARMIAPRGAEVARLERTRADLLDSYARVRYAEMVSANF